MEKDIIKDKQPLTAEELDQVSGGRDPLKDLPDTPVHVIDSEKHKTVLGSVNQDQKKLRI